VLTPPVALTRCRNTGEYDTDGSSLSDGAILQLVERGDLAFDDEVREYLPVLGRGEGGPVTVAELLAHRSGLPWTYVAQRDGIASTADLFRHVAGAADHGLVEDRYAYADAGYLLLGELLGAVDGRSYAEYVESEIFEPLGMDRSTFDPAVLESDGDVMTGYTVEDGAFTPGTIDESAGAAGGLVSSVSELATLVRCLLNDGDFGGQTLLKPDSVEVTTVRQSPSTPTVDGTDRGYGYGWEVGDFMDDWLIAHAGSTDVSGGYVGFLRDRELGVALAFNAGGAERAVEAAGRGALAIVAGNDPTDVVRDLAVREKIETVTGTYDAYREYETVTVEPAPAGTIRVTIENRDVTFTAAPDIMARDDYAFSASMGTGEGWTLDFREGDGGLELVLSTGKWTSVLEKR
jgi:CubicO group peptidase (beta-lactamase class C family)